MNPALSDGDPFEVLHHIGEVHLRPIDAGALESLIQQPPGRSEELRSRPAAAPPTFG